MRYKNFILALSILVSTGLSAQNDISFDKNNFPDDQKEQFKVALDELKAGDKLFYDNIPLYAQALEHYLKANDFNPNNSLLNYNIGKCYLKSVQKAKSVPYLEKARQLNPHVEPDLLYLLAQGYHLDLQIDKSIATFKEYRATLSPEKLTAQEALINKRISECETARDLIARPIRVFIDNLGPKVNSKFPDYGPFISANERVLIFTSVRDNTTGGKVDPADLQYYEDLYICYRDTLTGEWKEAINPGRPLNSESHDAIVGISSDGKHALIYKGEENMGDIYECFIKPDGTWDIPRPLPKGINTEFHESSAAFSYNMEAIYFASDRPGGYGGHDLYVSNLESKEKSDKLHYGDPVNLGPAINTPYEEVGVFMSPDGRTLYFSSTGPGTMGGYDIFRSLNDYGQWSTPENIGYPVNTADDDVFFSISLNNHHGYYSSFDPNGYGHRDLYMVTFLGEEKQPVFDGPPVMIAGPEMLALSMRPPLKPKPAPRTELKEYQIAIVSGKIMDAMTLEPLGSVVVEIFDNHLGRMVGSFESNTGTGEYMVSLPSGHNYGISIRAREYPFHSENLTIPPSVLLQEIYMDIRLSKVEVGAKIILENIFFDFNKATIRPESESELERLTKLLNDVPTLKIEISGHTDNVGSALYNQKLSEERAKAVVDYLIAKGIDPSRLTYAGYGFEQPVATNDTEEGRQENRRTEFKVLSK
jgi:flagellar motor protein MotB